VLEGEETHDFDNPVVSRDGTLRILRWHVRRLLDLEKMRSAARWFVGRHDFRSFTTNAGHRMDSTVRTVTRCDIRRSGSQLTFTIEGDGFLYRMCRSMVGTLVQIGLGQFPPGAVKQMLARKDRRVAGMTAPAHGLVLWKVYYNRSRKGRVSARR